MRLFSAVLLSACIIGCSGGKDNSAPITRGEIPPPGIPSSDSGPEKIAVSFEANSKVAKLVSPIGESKPGEPVAVRSAGSSHESIVIAVDDSNQPLLAGLVQTGSVQLTAESTALAFARLLIGELPDGVDANQANARISASAHFAPLTKEIQRAQSLGVPPTQDAGVSYQLQQVLSDTVSAWAPATASTGAVHAQQVASSKLPATLITDEVTGYLPVLLAGLCETRCEGTYKGLYDLAVVNNMPVAWSAMPSDPVSNQALADKPILLPASALGWSMAAGALGATSIAQKTGVKANDGKTLRVTLTRSDEALASDISDITMTTVKTIISFMPKTCSDSLIKPIVKEAANLVLKQVPVELTAAGIRKTIGSVLTVGTVSSAVKACANDAALVAMGEALSFLVSPGAAIYYGSQLGMQVAYLSTYLDASPKSLLVCFDNAGQLQNCATKLKYAPSRVAWVAPGVEVSALTTLSALDSNDVPTGIPSALRWKSSNDAAVSVDATTGRAFARSEATNTTVTVEDPSSPGVAASYAVAVTEPVLCPAQLTLTVGESKRIDLTNGGLTNCSGDPVLQAPGTTWDMDLKIASPLLSLLTSCPPPSGTSTVKGSCAEIRGMAPGQTTLIVTNGVTKKTAKATINVMSANPYANTDWAGSLSLYNPTPAGPVADCGGTWRMHVGAQGELSGTASDCYGTFTLTGGVDTSGKVTAGFAAGPYFCSFTGAFTLTPAKSAKGTFACDDQSFGNWSGQ